MNAGRDVERLIADWLVEESPRRAPDQRGSGLAVPDVAGVTAAVRAEKAPVPTALVAWTWNLTAVPLTSPLTTRLVEPATAVRNAPS